MGIPLPAQIGTASVTSRPALLNASQSDSYKRKESAPKPLCRKAAHYWTLLVTMQHDEQHTATKNSVPDQTVAKNYQHLAAHLPFLPNIDQERALRKLGAFLDDPTKRVFVLKGSAGTGKTSLSHAVIKGLEEREVDAVLAAPTGRAAGILATKADHPANTIHSMIYITSTDKAGKVQCKLTIPQFSRPKVFLVDEASMIANRVTDRHDLFQTGSLLDDLWSFVRKSHSANKIIFIGDNCQLPPVKEDFPAALDAAYLKKTKQIEVDEHELTRVERQGQGSPVLDRATYIRELMLDKGWRFDSVDDLNFYPLKKLSRNADLIDAYLDDFDIQEPSNVVYLASTNAWVQKFNQQIRQELYHNPGVLEVNDLITLDRTYYGGDTVYHTGEQAVVMNFIDGTHEYVEHKFKVDDPKHPMHNRIFVFEFVTCELHLPNRKRDNPCYVQAKILLNKVNHDYKPELSPDEEKALTQYAAIQQTKGEELMPWNNEYYGAMRIKYGHGLTVHKAQGGEWKKVLLRAAFAKQAAPDYRWLYTAITRAQQSCEYQSFDMNNW